MGKEGALQFFQGIGASSGTHSDVEVESIAETADGHGGRSSPASRGHGRVAGPAEYGAAHVFNVRDGKIVRFHEYVDLDAPLGG